MAGIYINLGKWILVVPLICLEGALLQVPAYACDPSDPGCAASLVPAMNRTLQKSQTDDGCGQNLDDSNSNLACPKAILDTVQSNNKEAATWVLGAKMDTQKKWLTAVQAPDQICDTLVPPTANPEALESFLAHDPQFRVGAKDPLITGGACGGQLKKEDQLAVLFNYYHDMRALQGAEAASAQAIANIDAVIGSAGDKALSGVRCEDPMIALSKTFCGQLSGCAVPGPENGQDFEHRPEPFQHEVLRGEMILSGIRTLLKQKKDLSGEAAHEIDEKIAALKSEVPWMEGDVFEKRYLPRLLASPEAPNADLQFDQDREILTQGVQAQLQANRNHLVADLAKDQAASHCLNGSVSCDLKEYRKTLDQAPEVPWIKLDPESAYVPADHVLKGGMLGEGVNPEVDLLSRRRMRVENTDLANYFMVQYSTCRRQATEARDSASKAIKDLEVGIALSVTPLVWANALKVADTANLSLKAWKTFTTLERAKQVSMIVATGQRAWNYFNLGSAAVDSFKTCKKLLDQFDPYAGLKLKPEESGVFGTQVSCPAHGQYLNGPNTQSNLKDCLISATLKMAVTGTPIISTKVARMLAKEGLTNAEQAANEGGSAGLGAVSAISQQIVYHGPNIASGSDSAQDTERQIPNVSQPGELAFIKEKSAAPLSLPRFGTATEFDAQASVILKATSQYFENLAKSQKLKEAKDIIGYVNTVIVNVASARARYEQDGAKITEAYVRYAHAHADVIHARQELANRSAFQYNRPLKKRIAELEQQEKAAWADRTNAQIDQNAQIVYMGHQLGGYKYMGPETGVAKVWPYNFEGQLDRLTKLGVLDKETSDLLHSELANLRQWRSQDNSAGSVDNFYRGATPRDDSKYYVFPEDPDPDSN